MKTLYRVHFLSLCIYIVGIISSVCLCVLVNQLLSVQLPAWIMATISLLCLILSATLRISVWWKKQEILTSEEMSRLGTKVFFTIACLEIMVAIVGTAIFFL